MQKHIYTGVLKRCSVSINCILGDTNYSKVIFFFAFFDDFSAFP